MRVGNALFQQSVSRAITSIGILVSIKKPSGLNAGPRGMMGINKPAGGVIGRKGDVTF